MSFLILTAFLICVLMELIFFIEQMQQWGLLYRNNSLIFSKWNALWAQKTCSVDMSLQISLFWANGWLWWLISSKTKKSAWSHWKVSIPAEVLKLLDWLSIGWRPSGDPLHCVLLGPKVTLDSHFCSYCPTSHTNNIKYVRKSAFPHSVWILW